jgi:hypothetical protein
MSPKVGAGLRQRFAAMSWWFRLMPVSGTATTTLDASWMMSHAASALMSAPASPPDCPVLESDHCVGSDGSFGVASAW